MRVLLDEHLPVRFARELEAHEVSTVQAEGWSGTKNGALLALATEAGFDVLVTNDSSLELQQNVEQAGVGIVVLGAPSNKIEDLVPFATAVLEAIGSSQPGTIVRVAG